MPSLHFFGGCKRLSDEKPFSSSVVWWLKFGGPLLGILPVARLSAMVEALELVVLGSVAANLVILFLATLTEWALQGYRVCHPEDESDPKNELGLVIVPSESPQPPQESVAMQIVARLQPLVPDPDYRIFDSPPPDFDSDSSSEEEDAWEMPSPGGARSRMLRFRIRKKSRWDHHTW